MKKLRAFTIIELVITLLISSIVISIIYYAYFLVNRQVGKYKDKKQSISSYFLFHKALQSDIDRADAIFDSGGVLIVKGGPL